MKVTTDRLWTVWTTRKRPRLDHTAHSPGDDGVGHFSIVKRVRFQLSRFRRNCSSGSFFDCQMGTFSLDKNTFGILMDEHARPGQFSLLLRSPAMVAL
jgi:hypothetical protein